ncbi:MAG: aminotransferase class V-fold PLP-dependent enzyme [Niabella sp.]
MDLSYIINELGEERQQYYHAVSPPIMQASNFAFDTVDELLAAFADEMNSFVYSRGNNPTVDILRKKLAAMDGAEDCLVFNSGAAATYAAVLANVKVGDHVVCVKEPYSWTKKLFSSLLPRFGVETTYVEGGEITEWEAAVKPNTTLFYLESPNSLTYTLQPLREVAKLAKSANIVTIVDNTYCTPLYQNVMEMGIDIAMQTATKYISGHSDTLGGVLCGSREMMKKIFNNELMTVGSGIQPFNAWLLLRGLRTFQTRLERIKNTTQKIVDYLDGHPLVDKVIFPFHPSFPQYQLAREQMKATLGLVTITLINKSRQAIVDFCEGLKTFLMAVSWGGHESLVLPRCAGIPPAHYNAAQESHRYIRLYFGLEDADYLMKDLEQALQKTAE